MAAAKWREKKKRRESGGVANGAMAALARRPMAAAAAAWRHHGAQHGENRRHGVMAQMAAAKMAKKIWRHGNENNIANQ